MTALLITAATSAAAGPITAVSVDSYGAQRSSHCTDTAPTLSVCDFDDGLGGVGFASASIEGIGIHTSAHIDRPPPTGPDLPVAVAGSAEALLSDQLMIEGAGDSGVITFSFSVMASAGGSEGVAVSTVCAMGYCYSARVEPLIMHVLLARNMIARPSGAGCCLNPSGGNVSVEVPFVADQPVPFYLWADSEAGAGRSAQAPGPSGASATIRLTGVSVRNTDGPVTGFNILSESGLNFNGPPFTTIPEPGTLATLSIGLVAAGLLAIRRRNDR